LNSHIHAVVAPIDRIDVDTDAILPKQFMRSIEKSGYGDFLFDDWRYLDRGDLGEIRAQRHPNPDFVLNQPRFANAAILLCRRNFGSGSAREHAVWALRDFGIQALIAPSFGDIFYNNCFKNSVLPIVLAEAEVESLFQQTGIQEGYSLTVDVPGQQVQTPEGDNLPFSLDSFRKRCLLEGLDDTSYALTYADQIRQFEERRRKEVPWIFNSLSES
jgi:3-isopropylmalate/(R)-2-methylmalate dehydratase small subunit